MSAETGDRITRTYGGFRGVDFRGEEINLARSPDSLNVWRDYKDTESIRTRPGMRLQSAMSKEMQAGDTHKFRNASEEWKLGNITFAPEQVTYTGRREVIETTSLVYNDTAEEYHTYGKQTTEETTDRSYYAPPIQDYVSAAGVTFGVERVTTETVVSTETITVPYTIAGTCLKYDKATTAANIVEGIYKDKTICVVDDGTYYLCYWKANATKTVYEYTQTWKLTCDTEGATIALRRADGDGTIFGIHFFKQGTTTYEYVHAGENLYMVTDTTCRLVYSGLNPAPSNSFVYGDKLYLMDGAHYLCSEDGTTFKAVEGYIPTTSISRTPAGGGTVHEDVNMYSPYRKNTFIGDGTSYRYFLDAQDIDSGFIEIEVDNNETLHFTTSDADFLTGDQSGSATKEVHVYVDTGEVQIMSDTKPPAPQTDGQDNVTITFKKTVANHSAYVDECTMLQVFDNRVFASGNSLYPNRVWHSSLDDPTYWSDYDYYSEGVDGAAVKGMAAGNNALWVFREPSPVNATVFYHTPTIDSDYGKIYPSQHSSITAGCVGKAVNFNDDIIFFSDRGMEGISGDVTTEQSIAHRSTMVDRKMAAELNYKDMILAEWEGYLLIFIGNKCYLADSRAMYTNENHLEYEFFYWEMDEEITAATAHDGVLYLGTKTGVYKLDDLESPVESYWTTPLDKFGAPNKLKTTNKKGSVAEATGDIEVFVKTTGTEWERVGTHYGVTDFFVSRIKRKKWKDISLKFYSPTRFSLEQVTLEAYIGGYVKR